jgi:hypothetical protein
MVDLFGNRTFYADKANDYSIVPQLTKDEKAQVWDKFQAGLRAEALANPTLLSKLKKLSQENENRLQASNDTR